MSAPPGFGSLTPLTLKRAKRNDETCGLAVQSDAKPEPTGTYSKIADVEKHQKSLKQRPWILHDDQLNNLEKLDSKRLNLNISVEDGLPKGVIRGCSNCSDCQKVIARWRPEESCRPLVDYALVFHPTEEEFKDVLQYIAKIRPKAEEYGICRIVPPDSWKPPCLLQGEKWESSAFHTCVQQVDALKELHSKRKLNEIIEQAGDRRVSTMELNYGSDVFEFECGPEFTLEAFKKYAEKFRGRYFQKKDIFTDVRHRPWENFEGEYWRIVQNPTEEIQVLSAHNLDTKVIGSGFPLPLFDDDDDDDQNAYMKSGWNLNNTSKLPGCLLSYDYEASTLSTPRLDVGMCFSSLCWKVEEHQLYLLSYMHAGASRLWYGIPSNYHQQCEAVLKKNFPEISGRPELFHKLVMQVSPSTMKSEDIPVYRCVQHPKQFVVIFPGAYYTGIDTGFSVSEKVNFAPLDWLPYGNMTVETYSEKHRKTSISYDKILIEGAKDAVKAQMPWDSNHWIDGFGKNGWFTRALKWRVRQESLDREFLCNASQSRKMEEGFGYLVKKECIVCFYDLYLSAVGCLCTTDRYTCLKHSKQLCMCPWSSRVFLFRYDIDELNALINALQEKTLSLKG